MVYWWSGFILHFCDYTCGDVAALVDGLKYLQS